MKSLGLQMTYVGGPTALLEFGGVRLLTDPTFDAFAAAKLESRLRWLEPGRATELPMEPETPGVSDRRACMKLFLSVVSVLMVLLGSGWLFYPDTMLDWWGVHTDAAGAYLGRRYGSLLFGYAVILWLSRSSGPSSARAAILGGGAVVTALVTFLSLAGVLTGTIGPGAWAAVGIEAVLTAGFSYYFLTGRRQTPA